MLYKHFLTEVDRGSMEIVVHRQTYSLGCTKDATHRLIKDYLVPTTDYVPPVIHYVFLITFRSMIKQSIKRILLDDGSWPKAQGSWQGGPGRAWVGWGVGAGGARPCPGPGPGLAPSHEP